MGNAQVGSRKPIDAAVSVGALMAAVYVYHPLQGLIVVLVGLEGHFCFHPAGALLGDGPLIELIHQAQLKLAPAQLGLPVDVRDVKPRAFPPERFRYEGRGSEHKAQFFHLAQFFFQRFKGIDGKARCRYAQLAALADGRL